MRTPPLLAFDMGNVLLPFDHMRACSAVGARVGLAPRRVYELVFESGLERQFEAGALSPSDFTNCLSVAVGADISETELSPLWSDIFREDIEMDHLVSQLARNYDMCLVSNTNVWHFSHVKQKYPIVSRFKHRVLSYETKSLKPEHTIYEAALRFCSPEQKAIFVDDIEENVVAAASCGMLPIHFVGRQALIESLSAFGVKT